MVDQERITEIANEVRGIVQRAGVEAANTSNAINRSAINFVNAQVAGGQTSGQEEPPRSEQ